MQMHTQRFALDQRTLICAASLNWSEEDIVAVTTHLNERFYGFKSPSGPAAMLTPSLRRTAVTSQ